MEIELRITKVLPVVTGQGKNGNEWRKQDIIGETFGQYPKSVCFTVWGDKIPIPLIGSQVKIQIDAESREYNSKWYTELKAFRIEATGQPAAKQPELPTGSVKDQFVADGGQVKYDLPF